MRSLALLMFFALCGCAAPGPKLSELNCPQEVTPCRASIDADESGVSIVTDTRECARVQGSFGVMAVCGGRQWFNSTAGHVDLAVSSCEICPHK